MKQLQITLFLILTLIQNVNAQEKLIKGDTVFLNKQNQDLLAKLELTDFNNSQADFSFRFWNHGQVVEIFKDDNQVFGTLTNYIYHTVNKHSETLIDKTILDSVRTLEAYKIIQNSGILTLESDNKIKGWSQGFDGITYIIEHADNYEYWYKNYWSPSAQDSLLESLIVLSFIRNFSDTLQLSLKYKEFKNDLPHRGCYNSGGLIMTCYISNFYGFGYSGSSKLPIGFRTSLYLTFIGRVQTDFGLGFQFKTDGNGNHALGFDASKRDIFIKGLKFNDFVVYNYQERQLDFIDTNNLLQTHQFRYGVLINNKFDVSAGIDFMSVAHKEKVGVLLGISNFLNEPKINTTLFSSIYENEIDYKIGVSKLIHFNDRFLIKGTSIGFYFENFRDYNDLNLNLMCWF
jgi:hypothetical protein